MKVMWFGAGDATVRQWTLYDEGLKSKMLYVPRVPRMTAVPTRWKRDLMVTVADGDWNWVRVFRDASEEMRATVRTELVFGLRRNL